MSPHESTARMRQIQCFDDAVCDDVCVVPCKEAVSEALSNNRVLSKRLPLNGRFPDVKDCPVRSSPSDFKSYVIPEVLSTVGATSRKDATSLVSFRTLPSGVIIIVGTNSKYLPSRVKEACLYMEVFILGVWSP